MSVREVSKNRARQENSWVVWTGDFVILKDYLAEKDSSFWSVLQLLDSLLRGFGQVVFANNPISGLLIALVFAATAPGTLIFSTVTASLGLLLSVLMRDSQDNIENGLTVYNPLLVGAASFAFVPKIYGAFDAFSILLVLLGTIFSVYLARSLGNDKSPCIVWPFILAEFALLFALSAHENSGAPGRQLRPITGTDNATSDAATDDVGLIGENATDVYIDWGMVFQGTVMSASQTYAVDSVAAGTVIYLAILIFSPTTAGFAFLGALIGSLAGLELGAGLPEVYSGFWGFNGLLTGASLGGNLLVLNGQSVAATLVAIVYTAIIQYFIISILKKVQLPILTLPFVFVATLFVKLRNDPESRAFVRPASDSFPEKQRQDYLANHRSFARRIDNSEESDDERRKRQRAGLVVNV